VSGQDETAGRQDLIDAIVACYLDGQSQDQILARYPQFEKELREFFDDDAFLRNAITSQEQRPRFGDDYEVLGEIGRGGMGIVYRAHQKSLDKVVAVKTITGGLFATQTDIERIHIEAQRAAGLRHPNIVTVHQVAEYEGHHFFVMEYIEGQSLAELLAGKPLPSARAAQYVKTLAEAIHYAHQRQVLHCDLKPANILLDEEGKPYVSDFGLAKRLGENARYLPSSGAGGTAGYMAPEQVVGDELTTATDVYGLGAILYTLLTGSPPFQSKTLAETLRSVRDDEPRPAGERNPGIDKDLEAICMKCLLKDKDQRYGSAYGLARDLDRYQALEETTARRWNRRERTMRWSRRNPVVAGLISAVALISILTVGMAVSIAHARTQAQLQEALQSNSFAARDLARTALLQLRDLSDVVEAAARDTAVAEMLGRADQAGLQFYIERTCQAEPDSFATCSLLDKDGIQVAREDVSSDAGAIFYDFSWRDYFDGARDHRGLPGRSSVHISKIYRSRIDDRFKLAISAPVLGADQRFLGVITTSVTTDAAMGRVILEDARRKVVLIAPRDIDSPEEGLANRISRNMILFHPAYARGVDAVDHPAGKFAPNTERTHATELDDSTLVLPPDDSYVDPVGSVHKDYQGRWIAGFAPVGNTGFVVIVQQRYEEALQLDSFTSRNLVVGSAVLLLAIVIVVLVLSTWARRSRPPGLA